MSARIRFSARTASGLNTPSNRSRTSTGFESTIRMDFTDGSLMGEGLSSGAGASRAGFVRIVTCCFVSYSSPPTSSFNGSKRLPNYFFSQSTWEALAASDQVELLGALRDDTLIAVSLFGWAGSSADFLFNISLPDGRDAATALLIEGAERLRNRGISLLNIGGGVHPDDTVEQAKQQFGARTRPLLHLREVFAPSRFGGLCAAAGAEASGQMAFFPPYHSPARD